MPAHELTEAELGYIMGSALLLGLVLGRSALTTALALMREYKMLSRLTGTCAQRWIGGTMAADSEEIAAYVSALVQGALQAVRRETSRV